MFPSRAVAALTVIAITLLCVACDGSSSKATSTVANTTTVTQTRISGPASSEWLGLNYNSGSGVGDVTDFSRLGVVYDRLGALDIGAGQTVSNSSHLARGLRASTRAGMVPDVLINPVTGPSGCSTNPNTSDLCLPVHQADTEDYVKGFLATADSIRKSFPHKRIIFEPMEEPWSWGGPPGTQSGSSAAEQYAAVLARLLPAIKVAGIPLSLIYVPAIGTLQDETSWIPDLYRAQPCLRPGNSSCGPIEGWNVHPYGPPASPTQGIASVPRLRDTMLSGQDNIIISEIGFCASDVLNGAQCAENVPSVDGTAARAAHWLSESLGEAQQMHQAGWLRALIIWVRSGGGWSMQTPDGKLTAQGRVLASFAAKSRASSR